MRKTEADLAQIGHLYGRLAGFMSSWIVLFVKDFLRKVHKFSRKGRNLYSSCITLLKNWTFRGKSRYEIVFGMQPRNCELLQSLQVVVQWKIMFWDQGGFSEEVNDMGS